ncbi:hypothetical protein FQ187_10680 [Pseudomonas sp. ANT_J28]|nr:hypothetical protein FQ187_10680 [Pseudomonas sp. ANT_J28]
MREAAFGCEAVVKSNTSVCQDKLACRVYDCFAAERSRTQPRRLGSCYKVRPQANSLATKAWMR